MGGRADISDIKKKHLICQLRMVYFQPYIHTSSSDLNCTEEGKSNIYYAPHWPISFAKPTTIFLMCKRELFINIQSLNMSAKRDSVIISNTIIFILNPQSMNKVSIYLFW